MVIVAKWLPKNVIGLTLYPFIFVSSKEMKENEELINHERIHLRQQLELLIVPFYIWYILEFGIRALFYSHSIYDAYSSISFEREAYRNEKDMSYIKKRHLFSFLKYL